MTDAVTVHQGAVMPLVMGIVNVTPDSFSDGGQFFNESKAIEHGFKLLDEGADILDIGGESTRPGSQVVDPSEEIARIIPVIKALRSHANRISVDTRNAATMRAALDAGVTEINDISALTHDPAALGVAVRAQVPVYLMHMQGNPQSMQDNPFYNNVLDDVLHYLKERLDACIGAGIKQDNIILDPGIGFGKSLEHNLLLLRNISKFHELGCEILLGTSRKRFIAALSHGEPPEDRIGGSLSSVIWGASQGVQIVRVHDVKETVQALKTYKAISTARL